MRLEGVAPGGKDHFLHLRVITDDGLRIDGLRVHYRLELLPPDAALGCAVDVPTLSGPVTCRCHRDHRVDGCCACAGVASSSTMTVVISWWKL